MRNFIVWLIVTLLIWIFPARWGAQWLFPELVAQYAGQAPWLMFYGFVMGLLGMLFAALLS